MSERTIGNHDNPSKDIKTTQTESRALSYVDEFREFIAEHPGAMRTVLKLIGKIEEGIGLYKKSAFSEKEVSVVLFQERPRSRCYKINVDGKSYFLKKEFKYPCRGGNDEFLSCRKAEELIEGLDGVKVIDYQLGYSDQNNNYFVSKWMDLPTVSACVWGTKGKQVPQEKRDELMARANAVMRRLCPSFYDVMDYNMLYDEQTNMIYLFDLHESEPEPEQEKKV